MSGKKRIVFRVIFIVLAFLSALAAMTNPATLILTALSVFFAVKVDFFEPERKEKKPIYRWAWLWAVAIFIGTFIMIPTPKEESAAAAPEETSVTEEAEEQASDSGTIVLSWDDPGGYGKEITLNAGTSDPSAYIGFYVPSGTYTVTNNGGSSVQVSVYKDGINTTEEGWEEPITGDALPIVLMSGEAGTITVGENEYIKLSDGSSGVVLEAVEAPIAEAPAPEPEPESPAELTADDALTLAWPVAFQEQTGPRAKVDQDSGEVLDSSEDAYLVQYGVSDWYMGEELGGYYAVYWVSRQTGEVRYVMDLQDDYQPGMVDMTTGAATGVWEEPVQELQPLPELEPEPEAAPVRTAQSVSQEYVLNTNTGKFHYPNCSSVGRMSSNNRKDFVGTREEATAMGYQPCQICNP